MTLLLSFLDDLKRAADRAEAGEAAFRREAAERLRWLERERAFAFRRLNLMRAVAEAIAVAESEEIAVASALDVVRARLGWTGDSDARAAVLSRFAPVAQAAHAGLAPDEDRPQAEPGQALAEFEAWYVRTHDGPFWALFDQYVPETPVVDF